MAEAARQIKGTRPEGAVTETDASKRVREMFTQIAPRYDLLNHLLSLQLDRLWRARTARLLYAVLDRPDALSSISAAEPVTSLSLSRVLAKLASSARILPIPCWSGPERKAPPWRHRRTKGLHR